MSKLTLILALGINLTDVALARLSDPAHCTRIPDEPGSPVIVCETATTYEFDIVGTIQVFDKAAFRQQLRRELLDWLATTPFPAQALATAQIRFWLAVPEINPASAQARVEVTTETGSFLLSLPIAPEDWLFSTSNAANLGDQSYPQYFGHRLGSVLVKAASGVPEGDFFEYLVDNGVLAIEPMSNGWYAAEVEAFAEADVALALRKKPRAGDFVEKAGLNYIMEWIAHRARVFEFPFSDCGL